MIFACKSDNSVAKPSPKNQQLDRSAESLKRNVNNGKLNKRAPLIMSDALAKQLATNAEITLIDVRTPGEIADGKIGDALEIDFRSSNFKKEIDNLDREKAYVVYCKSGGRSKKATDLMLELGFNNLHDLAGGYTTWLDYQKSKQQ